MPPDAALAYPGDGGPQGETRLKQVVLLEPGRMALRDSAPPLAGEGRALVRVRRIGLCGTDLHAFEGTQPFFTYPRVLGHELAVTVESVPDGEERLCTSCH